MADRQQQQQGLVLEKEARAAYELLKAPSFLLGNAPVTDKIKSTDETEKEIRDECESSENLTQQQFVLG